MKKVLIIILVVLLLVLAGMGGFLWYRNTHIFVEDAAYAKNATSLDLRGTEISIAHYEAVKAQLPQCEILWDVPFQDGYVPSDATSITITSLTDHDIIRMDYLTKLTHVDATNCQDYYELAALCSYRSDITVDYQVDLGGSKVAADVTELTLEAGDFDYDTLISNLEFLPKVTKILFVKAPLTMEEVATLATDFSEITVDYTVEILGREYTSDTTSLDLSALTSADVEETAAELYMLQNLETVELMNAEGTSQLSLEDVKMLQAGAPDAVFHYTFDFYGVSISTTDEEVIIKNIKADSFEGFDQELRLVLDVLENCKRLVLDNNGQYNRLWRTIDNATFAQIREDYRDKTKFVWRVFFGENGSSLTDAEVMRVVYGLVDDNCAGLQYCEDVRYMDLGHNEFLDAMPFVAYMPNLEVMIASGAPIKDLTPFASCKNLKFLEIANCLYITDLTPLAECTALEMLNISYTSVTDLTPIDDLKLTHLTGVMGKLPQEEEARYAAAHPDCWTVFDGDQPYGDGWRYDGQEKLPWYAKLAEAFRYPNPYNNVGWYLETE